MSSRGYDPANDKSWFFGSITRTETEKLFHLQNENGLFLVRESSRSKNDLVLCVRDESSLKQYLVTESLVEGERRLVVGSETFSNIEDVLRFYQTHYIEGNLHLTRPVPPLHRVITTHNLGETNEHLGFRTGEVFDVLSRGDDHCWKARSDKGKVGLIPSSYVSIYHEGDTGQRSSVTSPRNTYTERDSLRVSLAEIEPQHLTIELPAKAKVIRDRVKAYDKAELPLHVGDIVTVLEFRPDGQWYGQIGSEKGLFPFRNVKLIQPD